MHLQQSSEYHLSYWQLIFSRSKVNGAPYRDNELPVYKWNWPKDTYLQRRRSARETPACAVPAPFSKDRGRDARL